MKVCFITVTNDGIRDRRMRRLSRALAGAGWDVRIIGRTFTSPVKHEEVHQIRCVFRQGPLAYLEYNLRLWWCLRNQPCDVLCSVDLDTALAGRWIAPRGPKMWVIDCHEYFEEVPELANSSLKRWLWRQVGHACLARADQRWTVSDPLSRALRQRYKSEFEVIPNFPVLTSRDNPRGQTKVLVYLGVLNAGRGLEQMIVAMHRIDGILWLLGEGDLSQKLRSQVRREGLDQKVKFHGWIPHAQIPDLLAQADLGINLLDDSSASYRLSLANKFFDYVHAGLPQITMPFEGYSDRLQQYAVGVTVPDLSPQRIAEAVTDLLTDHAKWQACHEHCVQAREQWNWQVIEAKVLKRLDMEQ
ncbi:MAG: glycosyltransferase [Saprospiraceae bacterium]|nr:glycosyltransferase [Saprospiraceae bacterium]